MGDILIFLIYIIIGILAAHKVAENNKDKKFLPLLVCIAWPIFGYVYIGIIVNMVINDNKSNPLLSILVYICWPILILVIFILFIIKKIINQLNYVG